MAFFSEPAAMNAVHADGLLRAPPSAVGVDGARIAAFLEDATRAGLELHGLMLHRDGKVVIDAAWWPYRTDTPRVMHSVAKSVTACAVGLAIEEGLFALSDKVVSFFPEHLPRAVDDKLAMMTVEDLLTMRTGHAEETSGSSWRAIDGSWIGEFFKIPIVHTPGTVFVYTSAASYMLAAILFRTSGQTLHAYLRPRLFEPLGVEGESWDIGSDGINPGGNGLNFKPVDLLKFCALHAQGGVWNGRRLLPAQWVADATRRHGQDEYGYHWVTRANGTYCALGLFVQMGLVFPGQGASLVIVGAVDGSDKINPLIDRHFPDALAGGGDAAGDQRLVETLKRLTVPRQLQSVRANTPAIVSGVPYAMDPNPLGITTVQVEFRDRHCTLRLTDGDGVHQITAGFDAWVERVGSMTGFDLHHGYRLANARVLAAAEQLNETTTRLTWIFPDTAFRDTVICRFEGDRLTFERRVNVNSGALAWPTLTGRAMRKPGQ